MVQAMPEAVLGAVGSETGRQRSSRPNQRLTLTSQQGSSLSSLLGKVGLGNRGMLKHFLKRHLLKKILKSQIA